MPTHTTRIHAVPHGRHVRLHKGGELYAVPCKADPSDDTRGQWCRPDAIPDGFTADLTRREAGLIAPFLRRGAGRMRGASSTPDGELINRACDALGLSQADVAARSGIDPTALSRAKRSREDRGHPLTEDARERLRKLAEGRRT